MRLFCFGLGYVAERLARDLLRDGWAVAGTTRDADKRQRLADSGIAAHLFDGVRADAAMAAELARASHILVSVPPEDDSEAPDASLRVLADGAPAAAPGWVGYLSTTGVYGDAGGAWVDEDSPPAPANALARRRLAAERAWARFHRATGTPVDILRLAGIYGPGRSALDQLRAGRARRIVKPGQVFSRIHVDDIVAAIRACMAAPAGLRTYNLCDDAPAPQPEVVAYAAALLGVPPPPEEAYETAEISPTMRAFYAGCRRVSNARLKAERGVVLRYPTYREGLAAIARGE